MAGGYFSERTRGPVPRTERESTPEFWGGLIATIRSGLRNGLFAEPFPEHCVDGPFVIGTDVGAFQLDFCCDFPDIEWPLEIDQPIPTYRQLDVVEYVCNCSSTPERLHLHEFAGHYHLDFNDRDDNRPLRGRVNRLFAASPHGQVPNGQSINGVPGEYGNIPLDGQGGEHVTMFGNGWHRSWDNPGTLNDHSTVHPPR